MTIALDATYSLGPNLTGVGVYSREILKGVTQSHPDEDFLYCYRPHRFLRSYREKIPPNAVRRLLIGTPPGDLFHALNQRLDIRPRRAVTTFHDLFVLTSEYSTPDFRARFAAQARRAAEWSDAIIAVSRFTADQIENLLNIPAARIRVVPHGVHLPAPSTTPRENVLLFVGAIQKRKNVARLVKAFEKLPSDWRLILAGSAQGFGAEQELQAVDSSPRRASIHVLGYVTAPQLENLYNRASVFAFPSLDEGFGMPILEAMAHGVPVITANTSAMPEVAGNAALLIDPRDTESLAFALNRLASDPPLRADLVRRGLQRAAHFTWQSATGRTWSIYHEIA